MNNRKTLGIVVPCYNEQESIALFYNEIKKVSEHSVFKDVDFKILFVNDGSKDHTLEILKKMSVDHIECSYISFSRNFGKEAAIFAGLAHIKGDYCSLMDADLQDPPGLLIEMYTSIVDGGYDCVATRRISREGEPILRSIFAKLFYKIINAISQTEIVDGARDFRLMTRQLVEAVLLMPEYNRFSKGLFSWIGFNVKWISFKNVERVAGKSKWSFWGLMFYSFEGIFAFSVVPLAISSIIGVVLSVLSFSGIVMIAIKKLFFGDPVPGWPSMAIIVTFIGGLQMLFFGIMGQYLSKIYMESKRRPLYIIKERQLKE